MQSLSMVYGSDGGRYSSCSSNSTRRWKYHVFLSFRGEDTRRNFTDHLYANFKRKGIITFRDDQELERGQVIDQNLLQAIEESFSAIVVLSQNYASSTWCLDELLKILDSRKEFGLEVFPIFYGVDPSDVRHQKGSFAEAFKEHDEKFTHDKMKVKKWRDSLEEIANLSGWYSENWYETEFIENISESVWSKLHTQLPPDLDLLVGIDSRIRTMNFLIAKGSNDVRFVGIWGMGGIGKTTLAREVYERIKVDFEISCFLTDVREVCQREGLVQLQRKLLSHLKIRNIEIDDLYEGRKLIKNLFCNRKVILVLDGVSDINQIENLAGMREWFGHGSRVLVTTREVHLLTLHGVSATYEMKILGEDDSLQLFNQKAFKGNQPKEKYTDLSRTIVQYANGLPLALKVLGSFLCGKTIPEWEDAFNMLRKIPPKDILKVLKLSYDELEENEKSIFLNIACFFNGMAEDQVTQVLESCGLFAVIGIKVLIDKSLITINSKGHVLMHDMLQEMGKNIVFEESPNDVGRRSRLWSWEDIDHILEKKKGTKEIQWMVLTLPKPHEANWDPEAFSNMCDLRLLIISGDLNLHHSLKCFPQALKVLRWDKYSLDALPRGVQLDELVDFKMQHSKIKQLWKGTQQMVKLKFMDLSHCIHLIKTPNFDGIPNLERLILEGCKSLVDVHQSLGEQKKLKIVNLKDCTSLKALPRKLEMSSLETFILSGCSKIRKLPKFGKNMECLSTVDLEKTSIVKLMIWSLKDSCRKTDCSAKDYVFLMVSGIEIPSWFHNQTDVYLTDTEGKLILSFIADIPDYCSSSEWWEIAVCLVVHGDMVSTPSIMSHVTWFKCYPTEESEPRQSRTGQVLGEQYSSADRLLIFLIPCNFDVQVKHLQLEFLIEGPNWDAEMMKESKQEIPVKYEIMKYGWRVFCKEDVEAWCQTKSEGSSSKGSTQHH